MEPRRNIQLVVGYNGRAYHGWQRQAVGIDTIQQRIEDAATRVMKHRVVLFGAGRTDAGVHAEGQVANFYTPNFRIPLEGIRMAVNSRIPGDITIRSAVEVPEVFHASRSAVAKTYQYRICTSPQRPVHLNGQVYHYWRPLDIDIMRAAGMRLIGTHDFRGFATSAEQRENTVRTIHRCEISNTGSMLNVTVQGDGFLYNMVRNIVGTLIEISRGHWPVERIDKIISTRDRKNAGPTAPPDGLYMICVHYDKSMQIMH